MLTLTPIGTVRNEIKTPIVQGWGKVVSDLVLDQRYIEGSTASKTNLMS